MWGDIIGKAKSVFASIVSHFVSTGEPEPSAVQRLQDVVPGITRSEYGFLADQYQVPSDFKSALETVASDRLIPGNLHKESLYAAPKKFYYILRGEITYEDKTTDTAILTLEKSQRMSQDELLEDKQLADCYDAIEEPVFEIEWSVEGAYYGKT